MTDYNFDNINYLDDESDDDAIRYTLGRRCDNPLIVFGINPSTANPNEPDQTVKKADELSMLNGFDGWIMFNVYPKRDTNFSDLPDYINKEWHKKNIDYILKEIKIIENPTILIAFGGLILNRKYLPNLFCDIYDAITKISTIQWLVIDPNYPNYKYTLLTQNGMPRHLLPRKNFTSKQAILVEATDLIPEIVSKLRLK